MAEPQAPPAEEPKAPIPAAPAMLTGKAVLIGKTLLEAELAEAFGVSLSTIRKLRYEGKIPYVRISGGRPIYLVDSILDWLQRKEIREEVMKDLEVHNF